MKVLHKSLKLVLLYCTLAGSTFMVRGQITGGPPTTSLPTSAGGGQLGSGKLNFQPDLFTGRFTYSVPIAVPPGRGSSQPSVALNYNSSQGNGWCGVGWQFELGKIERETRFGVPVPWVTNGIPTSYNDSKSFTVDFGGVNGHLVDVSPAGQSPVQYRLQVDKDFYTFYYYNNVSNAYWSVLDKNGVQYFFGESLSNRLDNSSTYFTNGFGSETFRWALDRVVDPNGNATYITYTNENYQIYPLRISYNGNVNSSLLQATNTIDFILTNRTDKTVSFVSNFRIETDNLLSQIIVKANGQKVRRYLLAYTNSPSTSRSLLASVTEYGSDDVSTLPPTTFSYQVEQFGFGPLQTWGGVSSQGQTNRAWNSITAVDANGNTYVNFIDIDGDGLPDRVMRMTNAPYNAFIVQRNTGSNFVGNYVWAGLNNQGNTNAVWGSLAVYTNGITSMDFFDINGDGRPDRVTTNILTSTNWAVQLNSGTPGTNGFSSAVDWGALAKGDPDVHSELIYFGGADYWGNEEMIDLNGDGLVDRVFGQSQTAQFNTGNGFSASVSYLNLGYSAFTTGEGAIFGSEVLADLNGDGLPDVIQTGTNIYTHNHIDYVVSQNDGANMEPGTNVSVLGYVYTNLLSEAGSSPYTFLNYSSGGNELLQLIDINGDGLPDRVMTKYEAPYNSFKVQLNNGSDFGPLINWTNVQSQAGSNNLNYGSISWININTYVTLVDINGDGLPDRIMCSTNAPFTNWVVQLNLGPFPDLMCAVSNGIGGSVQVTYLPSTKYDNTDRTWTNDPWLEGAKSLLPFPEYTVSSIVVNDGFGNTATNTYAYKHGFFDPVSREFRGFNSVAVTDPYGAKTVTYFHQSGGFNDASDGEYDDPGSFSKKGMPYRVETWGTNGLLYQLVLNKVVENVLNTNGWYFPYTAQTTVMNYEGLGSYRATCAQFNYDTNTENLTNEVDYGEVTNIVINGQTFTDIGNDSVYKWMTYTNIGNILNRPSDVKITSDSAEANRLQENLNSYDANGNLKLSQSWLNTASAFITTVSNNYDQYGNLTQTTDAAGITTTTTYDSTFEQFPVSSTTGTFTSSSTFDNRSGLLLTDTDAKGLVSSNVYDVFFRPTANYISTNSYGPPVLWQSFTTYSLAGISAGISHNYVFSQVNNAVDEVNGFQTYTYSDGLGRTIETRTESETSGQDRVANTVYDLRGNPDFATLPYFSSGTAYTAPSGTYLGALTAYDSIGRACQTTPAVNGTFASGLLTGVSATGGDTGSPVGPATTAFVDGSNPWATVVTDANGKVRKSYRDAYGRTIQTLDIASSGNVTTAYGYDLLGNLTNVTDNAGNSTLLAYDSLGRKTGMIDPDMGNWGYLYDNDNRMTQQTDAKNNVIKFFYSDQLGRLTSKQIYNASGALTGTITYTYDTSDDPTYTVYPGQLYKVTDLQGYERFSYDVRGRVLKDARLLGANAIEYLTQATYDDADRIQQLTYPGDAATIQYTYDVAGHLSQVASTAGTGTNEIFYTPRSFNAIGQLNGYTNGNGVITTYAYFANSQRLQNLATVLGATNYQNLSYTYDNVSDVSSINDGVYSGSASASVSSISYDDLYRVTSLNSTARGIKTYGYNSIGNILTNQDFGAGVYQYGAKPQAVTSANGVTYAYDACGNMTNRGNQTLVFDAQNQLVQVTSTNDSVAFGYDDSGERLWRAGTNGYTIWIGGIYEINNGKVLCHVMAGGQLIATFEPQCNAGLARVFGEKNWYVASGKISTVLTWPFREGRGRWTMLGGTWAGIIGLCLVGGRGVRLKSYEIRKAFGWSALWHQAVTVLMISAFLAGSIGEVEAAPVYSPVFYFYHPDALGSSNILTDRSGNLVQHYEYGTFGQTSYQNNSSAFPVSNRYTGQIADDETGLYYYGGRYYDPQLGRFIQPDPTVPDPEDSQSFNRYSYCENNPLNETDPSGFDDGGDLGLNFGDDGFGNNGFPDIDSNSGDLFSESYTWNFNAQNMSWSSSWSEMYGGVSFSGGSSGGFGYEDNDSPVNGNITLNGTDNLGSSGNFSLGQPANADVMALSLFGQSGSAPQTATPEASGGGWLSAVTNVAGLLSALPLGPVATIAGLVNAGGEALEGNYVAAAIGIGGAVLAVAGLGVLGKLGQKAVETELSGTALARQLGQAGEDAVGITGPKVGIQIPGSGITRFPDQLTSTTLKEVKNVQNLSFTQQLRDYSAYAQQNKLQFNLYVRPSTTLTGPLQDAINSGLINKLYIRKP